MPEIMSEILMLLLESSVLHLEIYSKVSLLFLSMACSYQNRKLFCWTSMSRSPWNASACGVIVESLDSGWLAIFKNILTLEFCLKIPLVQMRISQILAINRMDLFIFCRAVFPFFLAILWLPWVSWLLYFVSLSSKLPRQDDEIGSSFVRFECKIGFAGRPEIK